MVVAVLHQLHSEYLAALPFRCGECVVGFDHDERALLLRLENLEYYFLYPHLETGALLILDDIHIPTVHNLFQFLRRDAMFELDEIVQTTACFKRTSAPTFDPFGDGWWRQNYNAKPLLRYTWKDRMRGVLPASI